MTRKFDLMMDIHGSIENAFAETRICKSTLPGLIHGMAEGTSHDEISSELIEVERKLHKVLMLLDGFSYGYLQEEVNS